MTAIILTGCTTKIDGLASPATDLGHSPTLVAVAALEGLLLSPEQLDTLLLAHGIAVRESSREGLTDRTRADDCAVTWAIAWLPMYTGSGWTAIRAQHLDDGAHDHRVWQAVVSFPLPVDANAYYAKQVAAWTTCNNRRLDMSSADQTPTPDTTFTLGQADQRDNILTITATQQTLTDWSCRRALTARNNVVVDIRVCGFTLTDQAESVAKATAERVPVK